MQNRFVSFESKMLQTECNKILEANTPLAMMKKKLYTCFAHDAFIFSSKSAFFETFL